MSSSGICQFKPIKESIESEDSINEQETEKKKSAPSKENQSNLPVIKRLFVGGLDKSITEDQLKERFIKWGKVLSIQLIKKDWKDTAFGYVEFKAKNDLLLHQCMSTLNMLTWKGNKLRIEYAKPDMMETYKEERKQYFIDKKIANRLEKENRLRLKKLFKKEWQRFKIYNIFSVLGIDFSKNKSFSYYISTRFIYESFDSSKTFACTYYIVNNKNSFSIHKICIRFIKNKCLNASSSY